MKQVRRYVASRSARLAPVLMFLGRAFPYSTALDPLGLLAAAAALVAIGMAAACLPAWRAPRVEPNLEPRTLNLEP